jgi:hypothetical protein
MERNEKEKAELREVVMEALERKGVLSQMKAQVRASIYQIIDNQDNEPKKGVLFNKIDEAQKLLSTPEGLKFLFELIYIGEI